MAFRDINSAKKLFQLLTGIGIYLLAAYASANPIYYEAFNEGGDRWRYEYTVANNTAHDIGWFTIYFDYALFDFDLVPSADYPGEFEVDPADYQSHPDWDAFVAPTDNILGAEEDGFYDAFALGDLLAPGEILQGFSVSFTFLGNGTPGSQFFEYVAYDADGSDIFGDSFTRPLGAVSIPEPAPLMLLLPSLLLLLARTMKPWR